MQASVSEGFSVHTQIYRASLRYGQEDAQHGLMAHAESHDLHGKDAPCLRAGLPRLHCVPGWPCRHLKSPYGWQTGPLHRL